MDDDRLARLEARVAVLEYRVLPAPQPPRQPQTQPQPIPDAISPSRAPGSLERLVAGRGLQLAGASLVLLGVAFFLELAFTSGWIGPVERILLGLATGCGLIAFAAKRVDAAYRGIAEAIVALGAGILYLSLWAAIAVFPELNISRVAVLAAMVAVTSLIAVLADSRRSERLAFLALFGGFVTPLLLANGTDHRLSLAVYVLALTLGALVLASRRTFVKLEIGTLVAVLCYAPALAPEYAGAWQLPQALAFATFLFGVFATAWTTGYRAAGASRVRLALLAASFGTYAIALAAILHDLPTALGFALITLAAVAIAIAQIRSFPQVLSRTYGYLGLGALTFALPSFAHETTLTLSFTLEAIGLIALGMKFGDTRLARVAAAFLGAMGVWTVLQSLVEPHTHAFAVALNYVAWIGGGAYVLQRFYELGFTEERDAVLESLARIGFDVVAFAGLSRLCLDAVGGANWIDGPSSTAQFALSLVWTAYATLLFVRGLRRRIALLRWEGLALFGVTILKVFVVDLSSVDLVLRIGSFVMLGIVLFCVSALYTKSMTDANRGDGA